MVVSTPIAQFAQVVSESGVVVREFPSTQATIITYINNGLQVTLLGEKVTDQGMDWEKVIAPDGKEGWVAARFLSVINP
jgi:SH3-like domain-containing protein